MMRGTGDEDDRTITGNVITGDPDNSNAGADRGEGLSVTRYAFGSSITMTPVTPAASENGDHGSLVITSAGAYTYTVAASNNSLPAGTDNTDVFTYEIEDDNDMTSTGTLTITVTGVNDAPVFTNAIPARTTLEAGRMFSHQIPTNTFVDPDTGATLEYAATLANGNALPAWLMLSTSGAFSSASVPDDAEDLSLLVTVTDDTDAAGDMAAPFALTVNTEAMAANDAGEGDEDDTTITGNVITGDPDNSNAGADRGNGLSVTRYAFGSSITMTPVNATASENGDHGSLVITAAGAYTYTVAASNQALGSSESDTDTFTYEIQDSDDNTTDTGTLTITITGVNDAPAAVSAPAIGNGAVGEPYTFDLTTLFTDAEDDTLMFTLGACDAAFALSGSNLVGSDSGRVPADTTGESKSCSVMASDGNGGTRTVNFNVPLALLAAMNDTAAGDEDDGTITGNVIAGDPNNSNAGADQGSGLTVIRYAAGSSITMTPVNANASESGDHGSLVITAAGAYTYTVAATNNALTLGQSDSDVFIYEIRDNRGEMDQATLTVTIAGVNDAPGLTGLEIPNGVVGQGYALDLDTVFTDAEGTDLTYQVASAQGCDAAFTLTGTRRSMLIGSGAAGIIPQGTALETKTCALVASDGANQATETLRIEVQGGDDDQNVRNILAGYARTLGWDAVDAVRKRAAIEGGGGSSMDVSGLMEHLRTVAESKSSETDATGNVAGLPRAAGRADLSHAGYRGGEGAGGDLQFWASASHSSLDSEMDGFTNDGDLSTVRAGFENRRGRTLVGFAVSHSWGDSQFSTMDGRGGESDFDQWMVTPYIARTSGAMRTWGLLGFGTGTLDYSVGEGAARRSASSDVQAHMAAGGVEYQVPSAALDITARAEGMFSGLEAEATELYEETSAWTRGARGEVEIARRTRRDSHAYWRPYVLAGWRWDAGVGESRSVVEFGGGIEMVSPSFSLHVEARGQGDGDYDRTSYSLDLSFDTGRDARGMMASLSSVYGLQRHDPFAQAPGYDDELHGGGTDTFGLKVGYGASAWHGLLTPYIETDLSAGDVTAARLGLDYTRGPASLSLTQEFQPGTGSRKDGHELTLLGRIRF